MFVRAALRRAASARRAGWSKAALAAAGAGAAAAVAVTSPPAQAAPANSVLDQISDRLKRIEATLGNCNPCKKAADGEEPSEYAKNLWTDKFQAYGFGEKIPEGDMFVHNRVIPDANERNQSSREEKRILAKDPATLPLMSLSEVKRMSEVCTPQPHTLAPPRCGMTFGSN